MGLLNKEIVIMAKGDKIDYQDLIECIVGPHVSQCIPQKYDDSSKETFYADATYTITIKKRND